MFTKELDGPSLQNGVCILDQFVKTAISTLTITKSFPELPFNVGIQIEQSFTPHWKFTQKTWPDMLPFQWYAGTCSHFPLLFLLLPPVCQYRKLI